MNKDLFIKGDSCNLKIEKPKLIINLNYTGEVSFYTDSSGDVKMFFKNTVYTIEKGTQVEFKGGKE